MPDTQPTTSDVRVYSAADILEVVDRSGQLVSDFGETQQPFGSADDLVAVLEVAQHGYSTPQRRG